MTEAGFKKNINHASINSLPKIYVEDYMLNNRENHACRIVGKGRSSCMHSYIGLHGWEFKNNIGPKFMVAI